ncbi:unnamed protein product [Effrenium voratum]|nr:unnamed protein product [Effrenium voratum]
MSAGAAADGFYTIEVLEGALSLDGQRLQTTFRSHFLLDRTKGAISHQSGAMEGLICQNRTRLCHRATGAEWMRIQNVGDGADWTEWRPYESVTSWASQPGVPVLVQYHAAQSASFMVGDCVGDGLKPCYASWHGHMFLRGEWNEWGQGADGSMEKIDHFTWASNVSFTKFTKSKLAPYPGSWEKSYGSSGDKLTPDFLPDASKTIMFPAWTPLTAYEKLGLHPERELLYNLPSFDPRSQTFAVEPYLRASVVLYSGGRTRDFEFPTHKEQLQRQASKGRGAWKAWALQAILRAAFASANTAARNTREQLEGPPVLLPEMNWLTLWSALKDCDARAANVKMLRYLERTLPEGRFLVPVLFAQHRLSVRAETPPAALQEWQAAKDMQQEAFAKLLEFFSPWCASWSGVADSYGSVESIRWARDIYNSKHAMHVVLHTTASGGSEERVQAADPRCVGVFDGVIAATVSWHRLLEAVGRVAKLLEEGECVLICCRNGARRSSLIAALILMFLTCRSADEVAEYLRSLRNIVSLNEHRPSHRQRGLETPLQFLRSVAADIRMRPEACSQEVLPLNPVMSPSEFRLYALSLGFRQPLYLDSTEVVPGASAKGRAKPAEGSRPAPHGSGGSQAESASASLSGSSSRKRPSDELAVDTEVLAADTDAERERHFALDGVPQQLHAVHASRQKRRRKRGILAEQAHGGAAFAEDVVWDETSGNPFATCPPDACDARLPPELQRYFCQLHRRLKTVIKCDPRKGSPAAHPVLLAFASQALRQFQASVPEACAYFTDISLCIKLASLAQDWVISSCQLGAAGTCLSQRQQELAMRAARLATGRGGRRCAGRRRGRGGPDAGPPPPPTAPGLARPERDADGRSAETAGRGAEQEERRQKQLQNSVGAVPTGPIVPQGGRVAGWGAMCNSHFDQGGSRTACKKAVMLSDTVDEATADLRLKRWLAAGLQDDQFPPHRARAHHVSLGGKGLVDFADGPSEEALDAMIARFERG